MCLSRKLSFSFELPQIVGVSVIEIGFLPELRQQGGWKSRRCTYECLFFVPEGHFEYLKIVKKCQNWIKYTISVEIVLSIFSVSVAQPALMPMVIPTPRSVHKGPSAQPPIDVSLNFRVHVSAD